MQDHGIVHPRMLERLQPNFYPSLCTIQVSTDSDDTTGETLHDWNDLAEHENIPCRISAVNSREQRNADQVYAMATHQVNLNGYYPAIEAKHRAVVDEVAYQIEGPPQHDGNQKTTRMFVRKID